MEEQAKYEVKRKTMWIGIDPDTLFNGVAFWVDGKLYMKNMPFFELFDCLKFEKKRENQDLKVIIEAGWLNEKTNWHYAGKSRGVTAKVGARIGANHETGKKIVEMCLYLGIDFETRKPMSSKLDGKTFAKITGYKGRTNQEQRDAAALVYKR
jgi:hypothetical protein